jgi:hypothetical protein
MTSHLLAALSILVGLVMTAVGDMASEEIRDRLDHLPHAILRLAAYRLTPAQRSTIYHEEWVPELTYILKGAEAQPITRLITGTRYALGILVSARRIARPLHREREKAPSNNLRPLAEGTSPRRAWLLTQAEATRRREAGRMSDYPYVDDGTGRRYCRMDLTAPNSSRGHLDFEWHGVRLPEGWRWKHSKENLDRMHAEGRIEFRQTGRPVGKRYLDEQSGASLQHG